MKRPTAAYDQQEPQRSPAAMPPSNQANRAADSGAATPQYAAVSEGRRSREWRQRNKADPVPLWGSFIKAGPRIFTA